MSVPRGDFTNLLISKWEKEMIQSAFQAVESVPGGWDFLRDYDPGHGGFMFSTPLSKMREINEAILERYGGHSGASYGGTMRIIQFIAKKGWDEYVNIVFGRYPKPTAAQGVAAPAPPAVQAPVAQSSKGFPSPCPCRAAQGQQGWCGVAGGGVPACDH